MSKFDTGAVHGGDGHVSEELRESLACISIRCPQNLPDIRCAQNLPDHFRKLTGRQEINSQLAHVFRTA